MFAFKRASKDWNVKMNNANWGKLLTVRVKKIAINCFLTVFVFLLFNFSEGNARVLRLAAIQIF